MANDNITFSDIEKAIANGRIHSKLTRDPRGIRYEIIGTDTGQKNCHYMSNQKYWEIIIHHNILCGVNHEKEKRAYIQLW